MRAPDGALECPLLANNGLPGYVAGMSALLPTADVRAPMSALAPISSALPPGADLPGGVAKGPFLTQSGHSEGSRKMSVNDP